VDRKTAAEFSFFLAVPTMLAASGYDLLKSGASLDSGAWGTIAIGFVVSFVVALVVIRWFIGIVTRYGFAPFAWYRIVAGTIAAIWLLAR
jgi:undecaprenyl-diphosphatase